VNGVLQALVDASRRRAAELPAAGGVVRRTRASLAQALAGRDRLKIIAEFKRSSPSAGVLGAGASAANQARIYRDAGATALSILTEPTHFNGSPDDLAAAATAVEVPLLMKDFIVDPAQIALGARTGASGILLILRCLDDVHLQELAAACREHDLTALLECHDQAEVERAVAIPDAVIGVNNRDLDTLKIDTSMAPRLLAHVPEGRITVAESGYGSPEVIRELRGKCNAVLVGEALMRSGDPGRFIREALA
jgi:indole-3-glycerol phosphate synthase